MSNAQTRILIIGCGGSGKSTLARQVGERTGLPVIHLDTHFWRPGWQQVSTADWDNIVDELIQRPAWVMDGNYGGTMPRRIAASDTVVFLDLPTHTCLWRILRRRVLSAGKVRPDMAQGCPEQLTWEFVHYVMMYRRTRRAKILQMLAEIENTKRVAVLRGRKDIEHFLKSFPARS